MSNATNLVNRFARVNEEEAAMFSESLDCVAAVQDLLVPATELEFHPVTNLLPDPTPEEFLALKDDIEKNGQLMPILVLDRKLLDGRMRYRICKELGIVPKIEEVERPPSLVSYLFSLNYHRRHLTASQRATVAVDYLEMLADEAATRQQTGKSADGKAGGRGRKKVPQNTGQGSSDRHAGEAADQAAKLLGTNRKYVADAKKLRNQNPELFEQVRRGDKTLQEANRQIGKDHRGDKPSCHPTRRTDTLDEFIHKRQQLASDFLDECREWQGADYSLTKRFEDLTSEPTHDQIRALKTLADTLALVADAVKSLDAESRNLAVRLSAIQGTGRDDTEGQAVCSQGIAAAVTTSG